MALWDTHEVTFWVVGSRCYPEKVVTCRLPRGVTTDGRQAYGHIFLDPEEAQRECARKNEAQGGIPAYKVLEFGGTLSVFEVPEPVHCSNCGKRADAIYDEGRCLDCLCHECGVPLEFGEGTLCNACCEKWEEDES